jgi:hypothetical protein
VAASIPWPVVALVGRGVSEFPEFIMGLDGGGCGTMSEFPGIIVGLESLDRGGCGAVSEFLGIIAGLDGGGGGGLRAPDRGSPVDSDAHSGGLAGVVIVTEEEDPAWISLAKSITCASRGTGSVVLIFALFRLRLSFKFSPSPLLCFEGRAP